jgi:hypothetical protein
MADLFKFSTYHGGSPTLILIFSIVIILILSFYIPHYIFKLRRDIKLYLKTDKTTDPVEVNELKDKIFAWIIGIPMFILIFSAGISRLI